MSDGVYVACPNCGEEFDVYNIGVSVCVEGYCVSRLTHEGSTVVTCHDCGSKFILSAHLDIKVVMPGQRV